MSKPKARGQLVYILREIDLKLKDFYKKMNWSRARAAYHTKPGIMLPIRHQRKMKEVFKIPKTALISATTKFYEANF